MAAPAPPAKHGRPDVRKLFQDWRAARPGAPPLPGPKTTGPYLGPVKFGPLPPPLSYRPPPPPPKKTYPLPGRSLRHGGGPVSET